MKRVSVVDEPVITAKPRKVVLTCRVFEPAVWFSCGIVWCLFILLLTGHLR